jgi:hypothetical protein
MRTRNWLPSSAIFALLLLSCSSGTTAGGPGDTALSDAGPLDGHDAEEPDTGQVAPSDAALADAAPPLDSKDAAPPDAAPLDAPAPDMGDADVALPDAAELHDAA